MPDTFVLALQKEKNRNCELFFFMVFLFDRVTG
jgi:hypothetical protein